MGKTNKISLSISAVNPYQSQWVMAEILEKLVDENETTLQVFGEAVNEVAEFYQEYYKDYNVTSVEVKVGNIQVDKKEFIPYVASEDDVVNEMQKYKLGVNAFQAVYGEMVKGNPKLEEAYKNKLNELSNN